MAEQSLGHGGLSPERFDAIAQNAIERLPEDMRAWLEPVVLSIAAFPDQRIVTEMGLTSRWELLGLYEGCPIGAKSNSASGSLPDRIWLFRTPIERFAAEEGETLENVIVHVLIHEIGHHFGLSDEDMDRIESREP